MPRQVILKTPIRSLIYNRKRNGAMIMTQTKYLALNVNPIVIGIKINILRYLN